jgi:hypothetical protein
MQEPFVVRTARRFHQVTFTSGPTQPACSRSMMSHSFGGDTAIFIHALDWLSNPKTKSIRWDLKSLLYCLMHVPRMRRSNVWCPERKLVITFTASLAKDAPTMRIASIMILQLNPAITKIYVAVIPDI